LLFDFFQRTQARWCVRGAASPADGVGQVSKAKHVLLRKNQRALDCVLQFANIPGPCVTYKRGLRFRIQASLRAAVNRSQPGEQMGSKG
jgi:hypothetical protein